MRKLFYGLCFLIFLTGCSTIKIEDCRPAIIDHEINTENITTIFNEDINYMDYLMNVLHSIVIGFKCKIY